MEKKEIKSILESLLFAAGDAVELDKLADIVDVDKRSLRSILKEMMDEYHFERRGVQIIKMEDAYQMCTRGEYHDYVAMLAEPRRKQNLSNAAIEVLAIVAYKQPVTRSIIEHIRGVNCDYVVNRLVERGLIEEVGRLDAPGRPLLFGTTQEFLRCFGVEAVEELPDFEEFGKTEEVHQLEMELEQMTASEQSIEVETPENEVQAEETETSARPVVEE